MNLGTAAFILLGVVFGVIFIFDGWQSTSADKSSLWESPKIRGLLFALGGSIISGIQAFRDASSNAVIIYTLAFVVTVLGGLLLLFVYAFTLSWIRWREFAPAAPRAKITVEAFHDATLIIQDGIARFRDRSDERLADRQKRIVTEEVDRLILQRDRSILYIVGAFDALVTATLEKAGKGRRRHTPGTQRRPQFQVRQVEAFVAFVKSILDQCLRECLEESATLQRFRASIYYLDADRNQLQFIAGVGPADRPHTEQPLDSVNSLAGHAIANPGNLFSWSADLSAQVAEPPPFERRTTTERYRSVATYAPPLHLQRKVSHALDLHFAISIDCEDYSVTTDGQYIEKMLYTLSVLLLNGLRLLRVNHEQMHAWLLAERS